MSPSQTLTFNDLVAGDGSIDAGVVESLTKTGLASPPSTALWFNNAPLNTDTIYSSIVSFGENVNLPLPIITCSNSENLIDIAGSSIVDGKLHMKVTTVGDQSGVVYTFDKVHSSLGGISGSLFLSLGPKITGVFTETHSPGINVFSNLGKVLLNYNSTIEVHFSEALASAPIISGASLESGFTAGDSKARYTVFSTTIGNNSYVSGIITSSSGNSTPQDSFILETVVRQSIISINENSGSNLTSLNIDQNYNLLLTMAKTIPSSAHDVTFDGVTVNRLTSNVYQVNYTPNDPSGQRTIVLAGARDDDSFVYNIPRVLQFIGNVFSNGNFYLNANNNSHYTLVGSNVSSITSPGVSGSSITGTVSRQVLSSGKYYFNMDSATIQLPIVSGQSYNEPFTLWMFGFWSSAPSAGGYPYVFSTVHETSGNFGVQVQSTKAIIAGGGSSSSYSPLQGNVWYLMALTSNGANQTNFYINGNMVTNGNYYPGGFIQQITLNNYLTNTTSNFNSNVKIGASGLTSGVLTPAELSTMKSDLETDFGEIS